MPLSAGSSSQAPCGLNLSIPNPLPHTPVLHHSSHDTQFGPDFVRRIWEITPRVWRVPGDEQSSWGGSDQKPEAGRTFPVPLLVLFHPNLHTRSVLHPPPPEPCAYSLESGRLYPLSTFRSPPAPIHLVRWMLYRPVRPLTVCPPHSPAS